MVPPRYNFYIGKLSTTYLSQDTDIDRNGNIYHNASSGIYASPYKNSLETGKQIFFNLISYYYYNAIFFYDKNQNFISSKTLADVNNEIITPPSNAKYWAVRLLHSIQIL